MLYSMDPQIAALIAAGRHAEAARALESVGDWVAAQAIYERIWDYAAAARLARQRGDDLAELRLLLDGKQPDEAQRVASELREPERLAIAADLYAQRRRWSEAARLWQRAGRLQAAGDAFQKACEWAEAAGVAEALGQRREAAELYLRALAEQPLAGTHAAFGRLLQTLGRTEEAVRHLQQALRSKEDRVWRRQLVLALVSLGWREVARFAYAELGPEEPPFDEWVARAKEQPVQLVERYQVVELLGSGGACTNYLVTDSLTGRGAVAKVLAPVNDANYQRFVQDVFIWERLRHPHIVVVRDFQPERGVLIIEHCPSSLERAAPRSQAHIRQLGRELIAALGAAHAAGLLHGNLKPANILIGALGEARLGDFGLVHLQDRGATQVGPGALAYLSPEQIRGERLTFASDLYALGAVLFELLTGRPPFVGPDPVAQHLGETAPRPSSVRASLAPWDGLLARLLQKSPGARHESVEELDRALVGLVLSDEVLAAPAALLNQPLAGQRYLFAEELARSNESTLVRAYDRLLERAVWIETWQEGLSEARRRWLQTMARHGGAHLQRVLAMEGERVVYETCLAEPLPVRLDRGMARRVVRAVCRALEGIHGEGAAHGAIAQAIRIGPEAPLLLVAGVPSREQTPQGDLVELVERVAAAGWPELRDVPHASAQELARGV